VRRSSSNSPKRTTWAEAAGFAIGRACAGEKKGSGSVARI